MRSVPSTGILMRLELTETMRSGDGDGDRVLQNLGLMF